MVSAILSAYEFLNTYSVFVKAIYSTVYLFYFFSLYRLNNKKIYWVSFLDGLQRILLFTESKSIAKRSESTEVLQIINRSIQITVNGIGVSVVNNQTRTPILYMAIASTGIILFLSFYFFLSL